MRKILVLVDYQNDFIDGALGFQGAADLHDKILKKVIEHREDGGEIICTLDTHEKNYLDTREGKALPIPHCIEYTTGHAIKDTIEKEIFKYNYEKRAKVNKFTFAANPGKIAFDTLQDLTINEGKDIEITFIGVVTNMCVISNAIAFQSILPEAQIIIDASMCASFNEELHEKALDVMEGLQMTVINR